MKKISRILSFVLAFCMAAAFVPALSLTAGAADVRYTTSNFSYNFYTNEVIWAGDWGFSSADKNATISIGWNNLRQTIMTFDVSDLMDDESVISSAVLNMNIGYCNVADYVIAAIDASYVDTSTPGMNTTEYAWTYDDISTALSVLDAVEVAKGTGSTGWNAITLDLANANDLISESGTLALFIYTDNTTYGQFYTYSATSSYPPYLSDTETADAEVYTVSYVDSSGEAIAEDGKYSTTYANTLGYKSEVVCPNVPIPYIEGYIFTSKSVSGSTITLTYTKTSVVDEASVGYSDGQNSFFANVDSETRFVSLNMLGAHDAFAISAGTDAAAAARGVSGASLASSYPNAVIAQDKTVLELLEAGARYFDVRLTRSDDTISSSSYSSYITNGVFYTTHNATSQEFRPILVTIAQWMKEHPGEVVMFYFQEIWDATADGNTSSSDLYGSTAATWADLNTLLRKTGINDFVPYCYNEGTALEDITYGGLTSDGTTAGAVMFARYVGYTQGRFYYGSTSDTYSWAGNLFSYYDEDNVPRGSFDASYIQTQVDTLATYNESYNTSGNHPVYQYARVMQAQSEMKVYTIFGVSIPRGDSLLVIAKTTNADLYTALTSESYSEWLTALPIVMVNAVGTNTDDIVLLLQKCNEAQEMTITYVGGDGTLAEVKKDVMVGTLYTDETEYAIVSNSYDSENGSSIVYSCETLTTAPSTSYNGAVVLTPSYGLADGAIADTIEIAAAETTDTVYTVRSGVLYSSASGLGTDSGNPAFSAYNWGSDWDRIGIAIVDAEKSDIYNYSLTATQLRDCTYGGNNDISFYAISIEEYNALDVSDSSAIAEYFTEDNAVYTFSSSANDDTDETMISYELDADAVKAAAGENGKIVIIGNSAGGLYGLDDDIAIKTERKALGVSLVDGAQIRIGGGVDETGEALADMEKSGLRFIALVNRTGTLAEVSGATMGVAIWDGGTDVNYSYDSTTAPVATIPADKYQDGDDESVFTAAIVGIDESNYNRIYVAVPYVTIDGVTYYDHDAAIARTPYEVAAGILVQNDVDGTLSDDDGTYVQDAAEETLTAVLNVYANRTGARITMSASYEIGVADYANGAKEFFTVSQPEDNGDGTYTITLTAIGNAKFYEYAKEKYRVNNNHSGFVSALSAEAEISTDGKTMTIKYTK